MNFSECVANTSEITMINLNIERKMDKFDATQSEFGIMITITLTRIHSISGGNGVYNYKRVSVVALIEF